MIVPVYNGAAQITRCLDALAVQSDPAFEIVVVDDGSTDGTRRSVDAWTRSHPDIRLQVVTQPNAGPAAARNAGAALATADLLLFTDADCVPSPAWVEAFTHAFAGENPPAAAMGSYLSLQSSPAARFSQLEFEERYALMARRPAIDFVATYSAAYRRAIFLAAGGFDSSFRRANNEDTELAYRLSAQGQRMLFVPQARVYHEHDENWRAYMRTKIGRGYWRMAVYRKHPEKSLKDSYTPQLLKLQLPLALLALLGMAAAPLSRKVRTLALILPFLASTLPLVAFARKQKSGGAGWIIWGSFVRALAFVIGVGLALLKGDPLLGTATPAQAEAEVHP